MAAKALQMRTERLREANERAAKVREQQFISGINPMTRGYFCCLLVRTLVWVGSIADHRTSEDFSTDS